MKITRKILAGLIVASVAFSNTAVAHAQSSDLFGSLSSSSQADPVTPEPKSDAEILEDEHEAFLQYAGGTITDEAEEVAEEYAERALKDEFVFKNGYGEPTTVPQGMVSLAEERGGVSINRGPVRSIYSLTHDIKSAYIKYDEPFDAGVAVTTNEDFVYIVWFFMDPTAE